MPRTTSATSARDRARAARAAADQDRAAREKRIEDAQVAYFTATDRKQTLVAELAALDTQLAGHIETIVAEGEPLERIALLLDTPKVDLRRLRGLTRNATTEATS